MRNESHERLESLFHAASERAVGAQRQAYLDGACGGDEPLRIRVQALLDAHGAADGFLEEPALSHQVEGPGSKIGVYKLLQEIGEGGMGVVYMAEQESPVRRKVALKVIKLGMDTKQVIARFEAERQALAMMDHANIARVFDAGSTETGRPYFVMELVRGVPIQEYCDTHMLSTPERLRLFVDVCLAVQHAHQKGIIHRDLKPSNVMVTSHDGRPVPKIIDFGVAKATNQKLTERTLFTEFHQIIGTPEYMSPEQAEMSGLDVDTRSDIYSLGVLLYQLLTGTTPANPKDLRTAAFAEMTRMIREDEPQVPSTRISSLGVDGQQIAKRRGSDARSLSNRFRGDLDWIVMKALEKDRTRRYDTASSFAADVERHLEDRPVDAGPPGVGYRLQKFVHRNRRAVLASLVLALVAVLGLVGTGAGFLRAQKEARYSGEVSASLQEVLAVTHVGGAAGREKVEAVLARARSVFGEEHGTYAAVLDTLVQRMYESGDFETAAELCRESLRVWKRVHGEKHPNVAMALSRLGMVQRAQGHGTEAEGSLRAALLLLEELPHGAGQAPEDALVALAELVGNRGEYEQAEQLLEEALVRLRSHPDPSPYRILEALELLFLTQMNAAQGPPENTVRAIYTEARGFYPDQSPLLATSALAYGRFLFQQGEYDRAEPYLREACERLRAADKPSEILLFSATSALFQVLRSRTDELSVLETDELLSAIIGLGKGFIGLDEMVSNQAYYAQRMADRGQPASGLQVLMEAHQAFVEAGKSLDEREGLRDSMTMLAFKTALSEGLPESDYALARDAAERALVEEPEHAAMITALGAALYRQGEFELAVETLELALPLEGYPGRLARAMSPADQAFLALGRARLGDLEGATLAQARLRKLLFKKNGNGEGNPLLRELAELIEALEPVPRAD